MKHTHQTAPVPVHTDRPGREALDEAESLPELVTVDVGEGDRLYDPDAARIGFRGGSICVGPPQPFQAMRILRGFQGEQIPTGK